MSANEAGKNQNHTYIIARKFSKDDSDCATEAGLKSMPSNPGQSWHESAAEAGTTI